MYSVDTSVLSCVFSGVWGVLVSSLIMYSAVVMLSLSSSSFLSVLLHKVVMMMNGKRL